eukprot:6455013-Amphidinium_carterae.2
MVLLTATLDSIPRVVHCRICLIVIFLSPTTPRPVVFGMPALQGVVCVCFARTTHASTYMARIYVPRCSPFLPAV